MSRLFYVLESAGAEVCGNEDRALVTVGNQTLECRIVEKLREVRLPLSKFDVLFRSAGFARGYNVGLEVTGILEFEIESHLGQAQHKWKETEKQALEEDIPEIADALLKGASTLQAAEDRRTNTLLSAQRKQELCEKVKREAAIEEARWQLLIDLAGEHREAERVAALVQALANDAPLDEQARIGDRTLGQWLEWLEITLEQRGGPTDLASLFRRIASVTP
jgi:hypothetical protein